MFTGLVADLGTVTAVDATPDGVRLNVKTSLAGELSEGDSVAVNGVCLTATAIADGVVRRRRDARVAAALLAGGDRRGLGRSTSSCRCAPSDRLGGHVVQGHVDGVAVVRETREDGFARVVTFDAPPELLRYVVEKGSIAVDGVSLTVSAIDDDVVLGLADPGDAGAHDAGHGRTRPARQPGGGRARQVRGEAGSVR